MNEPQFKMLSIPLLGFAAYSGTGKTTLLEQLLPQLTAAGLRIGVLKHGHHDFDVDHPGKDSYRLRKAGATQMLIASRNRYALMTETPEAEAQFDYLLDRFDRQQLDLILVEGCKNIAFPKIELHRQCLDKPWLYHNDNNIIAIASDCNSDENLPFPTDIPHMNINELEAIKDFILDYVASRIKQKTAHKILTCCDTSSSTLLSVEQGIQRILSQINSLSLTEMINLNNCYARVLAQDIDSPIDVPQYANSAMDGFAIRNDDLDREHYRVVAEVMAGYSYNKPLQRGEAVKIMTGAPIPITDDGVGIAVIMREQANISTLQQSQTLALSSIDTLQRDTLLVKSDVVSFTGDIKAGQNVRLAGEDLTKHSRVFHQGTRIEAPEMGMMASLGISQCQVKRKLKVAIFSTGDEVQAPEKPQKANTIYDSNRFTLMGMLQKLNCDVIDLGIIEDDEHILREAIEQASQQADVILTSGGVSVGDADYVKSVLDQLGEINFWRINMRPGRPLAFGKINHKPFFGLPGNPVAVMVSFINFVEPALRKMQGEEGWQPLKVPATATETLRSRQGRTEFSRGIYQLGTDGKLSVKTTGEQGSGILRSMSEANCLIEISPMVDCVKAGETVTIIPLQGRL